ncbi:pullulanase-associated domain-containing protein [Psychromonas ossibalaenae]|uniref:pullulanase-associated domain-containing protein n=1 Tax=Psychromonas ossibalaenae TaxID=444922 RepID=UPI00036A188C|nr:pullulanase-associated domain-containing protein [Psychromonas ossibalaenae]
MKLRLLIAGIAAMAVVGCTTTTSTTNEGAETVAEASTNIPGLYTPGPTEAVIYYKRVDGQYEDWGLHLWSGDVTQETSWGFAFPLTGISEKYGAYYVVPLQDADWDSFKFIVHRGDSKDLGGLDHSFDRATFGVDVFTTEGSSELAADPAM